MIRLDRYLAQLWLLARKEAKAYIKNWVVLINGVVADSSDQKVDYGSIITFEEQEILVQEHITVFIHKPAGYVSSDHDEWKYPSYRQLLSQCPYVNMLHVAGRLDQDTEGLLIASSDGQFIHRIISPKKKLPKVYYVVLGKEINELHINKLKNWVTLDDGYVTMPAEVEQIDGKIILLTIYEWKYHQVKRMMEAIDNAVVYLRRDTIWEWSLEWLEKWEWKYIQSS